MNLACPECNTVYRIDPARVPESGATTRCRECSTQFRVERMETGPGVARMAERAEAGAELEAGAEAGAAAATGGATDQAAGQAPETSDASGLTAPDGREAQEPGAAPGTPAAEPDLAGQGAAPGRSGATGAPAFGPQDPDTRAQRLARALVSDIVVYNRDRWEKSRDQGSLRTNFRDEVLKSWEEYVEQVGEEMAKRTPYFRDALNAILAEGKRVF